MLSSFAGGSELLRPEATPNPVLHRFMDALTRRALDPLAPVPAADPLAERVLELPMDALPAAAEQLRALPGIFALTRVRLPGGLPTSVLHRWG